MRGKLPSLLSGMGSLRITPAYAGKTNISTAEKAIARDHPRVCGENEKSDFFPAGFAGSPPRMRGKLAVNSLRSQVR